MASYFGSNSMFRAFAEALQSAVPDVRKTRVNADREGEAVVVGNRRAGTGYMEYAVAVVSTMRKERRGFDNERHVVASLRKDVAGIAADMVERREETSSGRGVSARASSFNRFFLRCEGSAVPSKASSDDWLGI